jgi:hypothetical protein
MAPGEVPAWCLSRNGGRGGGGRGGGGVASGRRVVRVAPPATQETSENDWMQLNGQLHATFGNMSSEEIRANIAPTIIEETLVLLREVSGTLQICALVWITKLGGQTAGDARPAPNVDESRPHSEGESRLGEQRRAEDETRAKQRAEDETRAKQRAEVEPRRKQRAENEPRREQGSENEPRTKQRAEDETRAKQRSENETRTKQAASSLNEEDEEKEEHSSPTKKAKYDRNRWYVVCATMIIVIIII